ncbi:MAG: DUF4349 domain-containing protein [Sandaracinaceae bacterium]|nr:DUF4349 domain-containing protein [Sandaracinaceae bacterium]
MRARSSSFVSVFVGLPLSWLVLVLAVIATSVPGCANEDRGAPPSAATTGEREEIVRLESTVSVERVRSALSTLRGEVEAHGGHVASSALSGEDAFLVARVPVASLDSLRDALDGLDPEHEERETRTDVTRAHADLSARLRASRATEERLLALLADRTASLADVLAAERELARVRAEIEQQDAEERTLVDDVAYATVEIRVRARAIAWRDEPLAAMARAFSGGLEATWSGLVSLAVIGAALSPAFALIAALVMMTRRLRRAARPA